MGLYRTQSSAVESSSQELWVLRQRVSMLEKELRDRDAELNVRCEHEKELMNRIHALEDELAELQPKNKVGTPKKYVQEASSTADLLYPKLDFGSGDPVVDADWEDFMTVQIRDYVEPNTVLNVILYRDVTDRVWRDLGDSLSICIPYPLTRSRLENIGIISYSPTTEQDLNNFENNQ